MIDPDLSHGDPTHLASLFDLEAEKTRRWGDGDLAAILRHQLRTALGPGLGRPDRRRADRGHADRGRADRRLDPSDQPATPDPARPQEGDRRHDAQTFGDLFQHPDPPLDLLRRVKEFAKAADADSGAPLPTPVATVLYYGAIVAALLRHGARISALGDEDLRYGVSWSINQPWLDDGTRSLFHQALEVLGRTA